MSKITSPTLQLYICIKTHWLPVEERNACQPPHNHSFCSASLFSVSSCLTWSSILIYCLCLHLSLCFSLVFCLLFLVSFPFLHHSVIISLCLFSFLSSALLLTSSAVLRPLHEANAHSGLAVAACMRSTGGPIKRRQEQEMERETASARPQGPRRYHHCPPLCVRSGAFLKITSDPPPSYPFLTSCVSSAQAAPKTTSGLLCVCPLGVGCPKTPRHPHVCVFSSGCLKSQNPCFCYPYTTALSHHALCVYACQNVACESVCVFSNTHTLDYTVTFIPFVLCVCCSAVKTCFAGLCAAIEDKRRATELLSASLPTFIVVVLLFVAVCCQGFPLLFVCRWSVPLCTVKLQSVTVSLSCVLLCNCRHRSCAAVCVLLFVVVFVCQSKWVCFPPDVLVLLCEEGKVSFCCFVVFVQEVLSKKNVKFNI